MHTTAKLAAKKVLKLDPKAFSSFAVRGDDDVWRRKDVLLECVGTFLRKHRDMRAKMLPSILFGILKWMVPLAEGLSPPPRVFKDGTLDPDQAYVKEEEPGVFDRDVFLLPMDPTDSGDEEVQ